MPREPSSGGGFLFDPLELAGLNRFNVIPIGERDYLGSLLCSVWSIAVLLPNLAVATRRLRDSGYGWAHMLWLLVSIAGLVVFGALCAHPTQAPFAAMTAPST